MNKKMKNNFIYSALGPLIICLSLIASVSILAEAYSTRGKDETIYVTGQAKRDFVSDLAVWKGNFSRLNINLANASEQINKDRELVKNFLIESGLNENEIVFEALDVNKDFSYTYNDKGYRNEIFNGYNLVQTVTIESENIELIENISRNVTSLIGLGVEFNSQPPSFYYTKLAELKHEMIAEATEDARQRAETIAVNAGSKLGKLKNANLGIFQIIAQNSSEDFSWGGNFNTSSKNKTATVNTRLQFGIK